MEESKQQELMGLSKQRRFRFVFTTEQLYLLEQQFKFCPYVTCAERKDISRKLNLPDKVVKIWFQNRRMREKKESNLPENERLTEHLFNSDHHIMVSQESGKISSMEGDDLNLDSKLVQPRTSTSVNSVQINPRIWNSIINKIELNNRIEQNVKKAKTSIVVGNRIDQSRRDQPQIIPQDIVEAYYDMPQDLSMKKLSTQSEKSVKSSMETECAINANSFINNTRSVIGKPIEMPIVTSVPATATLSGGPAVDNSKKQLEVKKKCTCKCHRTSEVAPSFVNRKAPKPQFIIPVLPIQNTAGVLNFKK